MSLFSFFIVAAAAQSPAPGALTLDEAIRIAEQNAFSIQTAQTNVQRAQARVAEVAGGLGPKIALGATYLRYNRAVTSQFNQNSPPIVIQPIDSKQANAILTLPIDISGNLRRQVNAARASLRAIQDNLAAARNDLEQNVKHAFFRVLQTEEQVRVQEQAVTTAQLALHNAQLEEQAGTLAKVDVLQFQTQLSQAQSDLIGAQNAHTIAQQQLNNTLGRAIETPVEAQPVTDLPAIPANGQELVDTAQSRRPEVHSLQNTVQSLKDIARANEQGLAPTLTFSTNYARNIDAQGFSARNEQTTGTLALNWPIFDSGVTRARMREARADVQAAQIQLNQLLLGISLEVRQALVNLTNASGRLSVANQQLAYTTENLRLAQLRFAAGEGIALEVTTAQQLLTQAQSQQVTAHYDYLTAYADLQRALGTDNVSGAATGAPRGTKQ